MNLFIPKIKKKTKRYPRWFNSTIRHQLNCLHSLKRKNRSNPTEHKLSKIKSCEEKLQKEMVSARECHEENLIKSASSGNTSLIFKHIRSITGRNVIPTMVTYGNLTAASDYGKATLFNKFFYSVFVHSSFLLPSTDNLPTPVVSLGDISITEPDVYTALASLYPSKAEILCFSPLPTYPPPLYAKSFSTLYSGRVAQTYHYTHFKIRRPFFSFVL